MYYRKMYFEVIALEWDHYLPGRDAIAKSEYECGYGGPSLMGSCTTKQGGFNMV